MCAWSINITLLAECAHNMFRRTAQSNKRLERTRREWASLLGCVGEPLKRSVRRHGRLGRAIVRVWCSKPS